MSPDDFSPRPRMQISTVKHGDWSWVAVDWGRGDRTVCRLIRVHSKWTGRWYKPWTWFRRWRIYEYEGGVWMVPGANPAERIEMIPKTRPDPKFYPERLGDAWRSDGSL